MSRFQAGVGLDALAAKHPQAGGILLALSLLAVGFTLCVGWGCAYGLIELSQL